MLKWCIDLIFTIADGLVSFFWLWCFNWRLLLLLCCFWCCYCCVVTVRVEFLRLLVFCVFLPLVLSCVFCCHVVLACLWFYCWQFWVFVKGGIMGYALWQVYLFLVFMQSLRINKTILNHLMICHDVFNSVFLDFVLNRSIWWYGHTTMLTRKKLIWLVKLTRKGFNQE